SQKAFNQLQAEWKRLLNLFGIVVRCKCCTAFRQGIAELIHCDFPD
ncbi:MAG: hypothetical protein H6Q07_3272, partial [Acidobacteria bacterium]|nr:hypothetical protein [Acidobacteriota bacterium]